MGGNAMAPYGAVRHSKEEYTILAQEVLSILDTLPGYFGWVEIPSYRDKDSYGDLDILFTNKNPGTFQRLITLFKTDCYYRNGDVLSLLYKDLQVDLIYSTPQDFVISKVYFSYNDLGNLMGKMYHKFGLKYGHSGLIMSLRDKDNESHKFGEMVISKDPEKIFRFIGLSYKRYLEGFSSLEEIFQFVTGSDMFNKDTFSFENMNSVARVRDKKRNTYNAFLAYIGPDAIKNGSFIYKEDRSQYLKDIFTFFPEAYSTYCEMYYTFETDKTYRRKLNGILIRSWLPDGDDIPHAKFGMFMKFLRDNLPKEYVLNSSEISLREMILPLFTKFKEF